MCIINDNFMLKNEVAKRLYSMVRDLPIIDYHCHLNPKMIAENYKFRNAFDLFLGGDHYKWRQMRTNGIDEKYITGDGDEYEKFRAFGWNVIECSAHDFNQLEKAFATARAYKGKPSVIIAHSTKGKGVSFMENSCDWHGKAPNDEEFEIAMRDLGER